VRSVAIRGDTGVLISEFAAYSSTLGLSASALELRLRLAQRFVGAHPDLGAWMSRTADARVTDLARIKAWPFVSWVILTSGVPTDIEFLLAKHAGALSCTAESLFPDTFAMARSAAARLRWHPGWAQEVVNRGITLALAVSGGAPFAALSATGFEALADAIATTPVLTGPQRDAWRKILNGVHQVLYEAGCIDYPQRHTRANARDAAEQLAGVDDGISSVMLAYISARASVLRPASIVGIINDLACFGEFLADRFPGVCSLRHVERHHLEAFCAWVVNRPYRGRREFREHRVGSSSASHTIITLRTFFDDIGAWGWAERPQQQVLFAADIPREPKTLPRALAPDVDRAVMAAVADLDDTMARIGLTVLRHTGLRIGELLDLELDCVVDYGQHGSWLRVPLGKLNTERTVPLQ
jgi:hypothetical protein